MKEKIEVLDEKSMRIDHNFCFGIDTGDAASRGQQIPRARRS
jgi:hypothetical protein